MSSIPRARLVTILMIIQLEVRVQLTQTLRMLVVAESPSRFNDTSYFVFCTPLSLFFRAHQVTSLQLHE